MNAIGRRHGHGRPKGTPNKTTQDVKRAATRLVEDPAYRRALKKRLLAGSAPHMETLLHYYAYGKPKEHLTHDGTVGVTTTIIHHEHDDTLTSGEFPSA